MLFGVFYGVFLLFRVIELNKNNMLYKLFSTRTVPLEESAASQYSAVGLLIYPAYGEAGLRKCACRGEKSLCRSPFPPLDDGQGARVGIWSKKCRAYAACMIERISAVVRFVQRTARNEQLWRKVP